MKRWLYIKKQTKKPKIFDLRPTIRMKLHEATFKACNTLWRDTTPSGATGSNMSILALKDFKEVMVPNREEYPKTFDSTHS